MKMVEQWWKKWSVQILAACIAIAELAPYLPEVQDHLPADWIGTLSTWSCWPAS